MLKLRTCKATRAQSVRKVRASTFTRYRFLIRLFNGTDELYFSHLNSYTLPYSIKLKYMSRINKYILIFSFSTVYLSIKYLEFTKKVEIDVLHMEKKNGWVLLPTNWLKMFQLFSIVK